MAWTESRSRDEWLAEVKRRGEHMRRRRRLSVTLVGVLGVVLPASALAGLLTAPTDNGQQLSVAGPPAPAGTADVASDAGPAAPTQAAPVDEPAVTTTTIEAVTRQVPSAGGSVAPTSPASIPPYDNPVVARATTTTVAAATTQSSSQAAPPTVTVPPAQPPPPCGTADVTMSFTTERTSYRPGEIVRATAKVERRDGATCLVPYFTEFQILNSAGKDVFPAGATKETTENFSSGEDGGPAFMNSSFSWEALDCTPQRLSPLVLAPGDRTGCVAFPAGTYTAVPHWLESSLSARVTFELAP